MARQREFERDLSTNEIRALLRAAERGHVISARLTDPAADELYYRICSVLEDRGLLHSVGTWARSRTARKEKHRPLGTRFEITTVGRAKAAGPWPQVCQSCGLPMRSRKRRGRINCDPCGSRNTAVAAARKPETTPKPVNGDDVADEVMMSITSILPDFRPRYRVRLASFNGGMGAPHGGGNHIDR